MKRKLPRYVHRKLAKGKTYYYFDTGARDPKGKRILSRLPDIRHRDFGKALQAVQAQRSKKQGPGSTKTFDWLVGLYERSPDFRALAGASKALYSRHLSYANANFRAADGRSWPLSVISAEQVVALRDKYADRTGTANAILKSIGSLYAWALKNGRKYVKENIASAVDPLEEGEHQPWPEWLIEQALDDEEIRLPVALLYFLGQRIGDTVRLGPQNVVRGLLSLTQQKTGTSLRIAVHERLAEIIAHDAPKGAMVFLLGERGKPISAAGLRARIQKWAKARGQRVVPHGLRKNAVNALLAAGCSTAEVSAITGQSLQMIEHYAKERDREHLGRSAILKFEALNKRRTGGELENRS